MDILKVRNNKKNCFTSYAVNYLTLIALCLNFQISPLYSDEFSWLQTTQAPFIVYYTTPDSEHSITILHALQSAYSGLVADLNDTSKTTINIFVCPSQSTFDEITGHLIPEWGEAAADIAKRRIILKSPNWVTYSMDMKTVVAHELAHIVVGNIANKNPVPRWLNEGIAIYYSQDANYLSGSLISKALLTKSMIPLDEIDSVLKFYRIRANLAYQQSYFAAKYLIDNYGEHILSAIIHEIGRGQDIQSTFLQTTGSDFTSFERDWLLSLQSSHKWSFLYDAGSYLWIGIGLLFILAFIAIKWQRRQTLKRWAEEEDL